MSFTATPFRPFARERLQFRGLLAPASAGQVGTRPYRNPGARENRAIAGVTRDSAGVALGNCEVDLFLTGGDLILARTMSDASGNYRFDNPGSGPFFAVGYLPGSPDVAGTTVRTLAAT